MEGALELFVGLGAEQVETASQHPHFEVFAGND